VKFIFVLTAFFCSFVLQISASQIFSTSNLNEIELLIDEADQNTMILFDVDQTLLTPDDPILKPKWEKLLDEWLGGKKFSTDESGKTRYVFREILMSAPHSLLDQNSLLLVEKIQKKQIPVIAFTAAPGGKIGKTESFVDWRIDELKRFGFDFSSSFPKTPVLELPKHPELEFPPIYKSGVLVSSLHEKGPVLIDFFNAVRWTPKKVIFIDDQIKNIQSVVQSLAGHTRVIGVHYTAARELPCELNEQQAHSQINHFLKTEEWLSQIESVSITPN